jgi:hypothetical protein
MLRKKINAERERWEKGKKGLSDRPKISPQEAEFEMTEFEKRYKKSRSCTFDILFAFSLSFFPHQHNSNYYHVFLILLIQQRQR